MTDAEILDLQILFQDRQQTKPLGEVDLRYSPTCKASWIRTIAFATTAGVFKAIHAMLVFHNHTKEDIVGTSIVPSTITPSTAWTDMTVAPLLPHADQGVSTCSASPNQSSLPYKSAASKPEPMGSERNWT